jgi:hypothetical protein
VTWSFIIGVYVIERKRNEKATTSIISYVVGDIDEHLIDAVVMKYCMHRL